MAQRKNFYRDSRIYYNTYEDGNAVRETSYDYDVDYDDDRQSRRRKRIDRLHDKRIKEQAREERAKASRLRKLERSRGINLAACILFCIATAIVYNLARGYLDVNSSITAMEKQVAGIESSYDTLKAKNDSALEEINASVDLKAIYETAVNDLGMVFAQGNQIVEYEDNEASYVRNYEDIPEEEKNNIIDDILNSLD